MGSIPFSNPAGKNQTSPGSGMPPGGGLNQGKGGLVTGVPGGPSAQSNPYLASPTAASPTSATPGAVPAGAAATSSTPTSASQGFITGTNSTTNGQNNLANQLDDIYGAGVGASLFSLLNGMSGTNSTILQEYIQSLLPQEATAQANTNAALGAGGVSANSSVTALADSNLQAQEFGAIASESANLTQSQEQLTAQLLSGMEPAAAKEVATSNWTIFGDVLGDAATDIGAIIHGGQGAQPGNKSTGGSSGSSSGGVPSSQNTVSNATSQLQAIPSGQLDEDDAGEDAGLDLAAFA